ncbi:MAG: hypothetical protein J0L58_20095 [Burkholderiales bacterium]|nr:hypothetical protein [Burkholderiales bacterium]
MKSHVERLRRTGVYRHVPRSAKVPLRLRPTNILQFDKRYRDLRSLWDAFASASADDQATEAEKYQRIASKQSAYQRYVLLLLSHALNDMRAERIVSSKLGFRVGPWDLEIDAEHLGEVHIRIHALGELLRTRTIVLLLAKEAEPIEESPLRSTFYAEDLTATGETGVQDQDQRVLNPFRFFGVERIRQILERDLSELFLDRYPPAVDRVSPRICDTLSRAEAEVFKLEGNRLVVLPSSKVPVESLFRLISESSGSQQETAASLRHAIGLGQWLLRCRACGVNASGLDMSADTRALRLVCQSCRLETTLKSSPTRSMTTRFLDWNSGFELCGGVEVQVPY